MILIIFIVLLVLSLGARNNASYISQTSRRLDKTGGNDVIRTHELTMPRYRLVEHLYLLHGDDASGLTGNQIQLLRDDANLQVVDKDNTAIKTEPTDTVIKNE
eukprot:519605_1